MTDKKQPVVCAGCEEVRGVLNTLVHTLALSFTPDSEQTSCRGEHQPRGVFRHSASSWLQHKDLGAVTWGFGVPFIETLQNAKLIFTSVLFSYFKIRSGE